MQSDRQTSLSFSLAARALATGSTAVILHLYRDGQLAQTSTLTVCDRQTSVRVWRDCLSHFRRLGIPQVNGTGPMMPALPRGTGEGRGGSARPPLPEPRVSIR